MISSDRQNRIFDIVLRDHSVAVPDLARRFDVSPMTVRRDLASLAEAGLVERVYGGARLHSRAGGIPVSQKLIEHVAEKASIAKTAAALVQDGEVIAIDAGTTAVAFARELRGKNLTVVTNSFRVMDALVGAPNITLVGTGGFLMETALANSHLDPVFVGPIAEATLRQFRPSKAFLGTAGITLEEGLTDSRSIQYHIKAVMMEISREVYLLADHSKFGRVLYSVVGPVERLTGVVTDDGLSGQWRADLESLGVRVLVAEGAKSNLPA